MIRRFFKKLLTPPMMVIAALIMFCEEWIWDHLAAFMAWVGRAPVLRWAERRIAALPPYPAMAVFLLPSALLLPVNIFAVYLAARGHALTGTTILVAAKLAGTAILARLFSICRPSLLTVNWFRRLYEWLGRLKARLYSSAPWRAAVEWKNKLKARVARLFHRWRGGHLKRRWRAVVHWLGLKVRRRKPAEIPAQNQSAAHAAYQHQRHE
jgi:hypothetical protein